MRLNASSITFWDKPCYVEQGSPRPKESECHDNSFGIGATTSEIWLTDIVEQLNLNRISKKNLGRWFRNVKIFAKMIPMISTDEQKEQELDIFFYLSPDVDVFDRVITRNETHQE